MTSVADYVLGTHDEELERLGVQHRAWQACTLAAWRSAGIARGQTVLDVGCGPGYASLDLAELVGPSGSVVAIDKSAKFLGALNAERCRRKIDNISTYSADLDIGEFPDVMADAAWCRWVFAFLTKPHQVLSRLASAVRPGGTIVVHEYFDYSTWRTAPRCAELEVFVKAVMASWRDAKGEPDIALSLPSWFESLGFEIRSVHPIIDVVQPGHPKWGWLQSFIEVGRQRLVDLGYLTAAEAESVWQAFKAVEAAPGTRMISPAVLEIIAQRRTPA
jgi:SAM-dependent methyltransferase